MLHVKPTSFEKIDRCLAVLDKLDGEHCIHRDNLVCSTDYRSRVDTSALHSTSRLWNYKLVPGR
jgi:hypothetical protein